MENDLVKPVVAKTEKGRKTKLQGYKAEVLVKEKLWRYGYKVQHKNTVSPYDLLVSDTIKVEVRSSQPKVSESTGKVSWTVMFNRCSDIRFDVLVVVLYQHIDEPLVLFYSKTFIKYVLKTNFCSITFSDRHKDLLEAGEKSPYNLLGNPKKVINS